MAKAAKVRDEDMPEDEDQDSAINELDERFIIRRIQGHIERGINSEDGDVTDQRQAMFSAYSGDKYGNEREGYSEYVSRQVLEAVEWAAPSLLRVFTGGVKPVEFSASGPDDEQQAKHETDVVSYWFFDGNPEESGFLVLYGWIKDILLYPNGYVKVSIEEDEETNTEYFTGLLPEQVELIAEDEDAEVVVTKEYGTPDPATGAKMRVQDISVTKTETSKRIVVAPIPPDHCIIAHGHHKLDVDKSMFTCIRNQQTRSDLRLAGYSEDQLADLSPDDDETWNSEAVTRYFYADEEPTNDSDEFDTEADELFWVHECYMFIDVDNDGINEFRKIVMAGCRILENEPTDYNPVVAAAAIHMTHKHIGMSYAELVADLQELMTTLTRQLLDNIYKQNVSRTFISEGALLSDNVTMDQLLDGTSEVVTVRGDPHVGVMPEQVTPIVAEIAQVMDGMKDAPQMRTGVAPQLALDPGVLEKSTMGAFVGALEQASQRLELLARLFAETGLKRLFQKIHYLLREHFDKPQKVKINNQWIDTDPSKWKRRSNMNVNVGLGFNNKTMMLQLLAQLLAIQKEAMPSGLSDVKTIFNTLEKLIEQMNLGHATTYFLDPKDPAWKPPQPQEPPEMIMAKAQAEALKSESARKDKELEAKIALDNRKLEAEIAKNTEAAESQGVGHTNDLLAIKQKARDAERQDALADSTIQKNNFDSQQPPDSADEFGRAKARTASDSAPKKAKATA